MASDFNDLEKRLNADTAVRDRFLKNPTAFLKREGITMTADQRKDLADAIAKITVSRETAGKRARKIVIRMGGSISLFGK